MTLIYLQQELLVGTWTAEDVLVRVSVIVALIAVATAGARIAVTGFRRLDTLQDQQSWVREQMEHGGSVGNDPTVRQLVEVTAERMSNLTQLAVVNEQRLERIEQNQQLQGRKLAPMAQDLAELKAIVQRHEGDLDGLKQFREVVLRRLLDLGEES